METIRLMVTDNSVLYFNEKNIITDANATSFQKWCLDKFCKKIIINTMYAEMMISIKLLDDNYIMFDFIYN